MTPSRVLGGSALTGGAAYVGGSELSGEEQAAPGTPVELTATATGRGLTAAELDKVTVFASAEPDGDVSNDGWVNELGEDTGLFESINEPSPDAGDYVQAPLTDQPIVLVTWEPS